VRAGPGGEDDHKTPATPISSWRDAIFNTPQGKQIVRSYMFRLVIGFAIFTGIAYLVVKGWSLR